VACIGASAGGAAGGTEGPSGPGHLARDSAGQSGQALRYPIVGGGDYEDVSSSRKGAVMRARAGDTLVVPGGHTRTGVILRVVGRNGAPPYVIKWLSDGHIAMVTPDQYSRIVAASDDRAGQSLDGQ
jgi:hypothetical protein